MAARAQTITLQYVAWNTQTNAGQTGDVGNHTLRWVKDGTSAAPANGAAEVDSTNAPGLYKLVMTSAEATCDVGTLAGKSATLNVSVIPVTISFEQLPTAAPGTNGGLPTGNSSNQVTVSQAFPTNFSILTIDGSGRVDLGKWLGVAPNALVSGKVDASASVVDDTLLDTGTTQSGTTSSVVLRAGAPAGLFPQRALILFTSGAAKGEVGIFNTWNSGTVTMTPEVAFTNAPGACTYDVYAVPPSSATITVASLATSAKTDVENAVWEAARASHLTAGSFGRFNQSLRDGTAQAGAGSTITLDAGASATDSFYNNDLIQLTGGTGVGQSRFISGYVGATKVATLNAAWSITPDNTSQFQILPFGTINSVATVSGSVGSVTAGVTVATNSDKTGYALAAGEYPNISNNLLDLANAVETGLTFRQATRAILAEAAGLVSGATTTTVTITNAGPQNVNRIVATVDANGNRTAITYTL